MNEQELGSRSQSKFVGERSATNLLIADLGQLVADRQIVALVGAGVSQNATGNAPVSSWIGLLRDGIDRCLELGVIRPERATELHAAVEAGTVDGLLATAESISTNLGGPMGGEYGRWLRESVGALTVQRTELLEALRDLQIPLATTNYDGLLEEITGWRPVTWQDRARVERVLREAEPGILHLHGHWETPESVVLGIHSYDRITADLHAQAALRALRMTRSLLFVGFGTGLADPNLGALLQWSREVFAGSEYRNFRLARSNEAQTLQEQHPIEERIFVVPYGENYEDLAPFLSNIRVAGIEPHEGDVVATSPRPRALARCDESFGSGTGNSASNADGSDSDGSDDARFELSGLQIKAIRVALESAFPTIARLTVMVREELNEKLAAIAAGQDITEVAFGLIIWADSNGRVQELIAGAHSNKPNDPALLQLEETLANIHAIDLPDVVEESLVKMVARGRLDELKPPIHTALPVLPTAEAIGSPSIISTYGAGPELEPLEVEIRVGDVSARAPLPLGTETEFALALGSDVEAVLRMRRKG